jgi:UDP-N-acetylglucosamine/UDP-N-acetylgalactosamine 4-epimerase
MQNYQSVLKSLEEKPHSWLITGVAGFIGSHLLEVLLNANQKIIGLDNFSTGKKLNLQAVENKIDKKYWNNFNFIEGDITSINICKESVRGIDYVLHQAALGSVPRSIKTPIDTHHANCSGFLNILNASMEENVKSFTYASSSAVYGDHLDLPKVEEQIGNSLSPYAVSKHTNELYASVFANCYGFRSIGLRYFNVFGSRQDPEGAYAAVIPRWEDAIHKNADIYIYGDGKTSRDFCYIDNVVQANILAATASLDAKDNIYNIALGEQTSLNELFQLMRNIANESSPSTSKAVYEDFREGDIRHSNADISKAVKMLNYDPQYTLEQGLRLMLESK